MINSSNKFDVMRCILNFLSKSRHRLAVEKCVVSTPYQIVAFIHGALCNSLSKGPGPWRHFCGRPESVRKVHLLNLPDYKRECACVQDVECAFARLKGRFRILKLPLRFHKIEDIDNIVFTCATLHNMIAVDDGLDRRRESDVTWEGADGLYGDTLVDDDDPDDVDIERVQSVHGRPVRAGDDYSAVGMVSA